ncbi:hypothetical protein J0H58_06060 [bacterium]|nr:hypothetical protein [bacterium]
MHAATKDDLTRLLGEQRTPCVSIYLATQKTYPDRQQVPLRYRDLVDRAEEALRRTHPDAGARPVVDRLRALEEDKAFWNQGRAGQAGLAVLASPTALDTFDLRTPPPERVSVADTFLVTPLLRVAQSADRFQVLCLQREEARLYEGNRDGLTPVEPVGVPRTVTDALGAWEPTGAQGEDHPAAGTDAKREEERFFRAVDRAVWERVSRPSGLPLVLVALPEQQTAFRALSHNPQLLAAGVERGPGQVTGRELLTGTWACVEPGYLARLEKMVDDFYVALDRGQAADDVREVAHAAHAGRVASLMVEADRTAPGRLDPGTGAVRSAADLEAGDVLDDLAELVLRRKGEVVVVPRDRMPTATGAAAVFRF